MDIKLFFLGLLLTCFYGTPIHASPVGDLEEVSIKDDKEAVTTEEDYKVQVLENKAGITASIAKSLATKAKVVESSAKAYEQLAIDRGNSYQKYSKLHDEAKLKAKENKQKYLSESSTVEVHEAKRKDWNAKSREAETQAKDQEVISQRMCSEVNEWARKMEGAAVSAATAEARASGYDALANTEHEWVLELKRRIEDMINDAKTHFTEAKGAEQAITAEKAKAQQQAEEAQKRLQTAQALQEHALRTEVASRDSLAKSIALMVRAEEARNAAKEDELAAEMEEMLSNELTRRVQSAEAILKLVEHEYRYYMEREKKEEGKAKVLSRSAKEVESAAISDSASLMRLATAKESDIYKDDYQPAEYPADQPVKAFPGWDQKLIDSAA